MQLLLIFEVLILFPPSYLKTERLCAINLFYDIIQGHHKEVMWSGTHHQKATCKNLKFNIKPAFIPFGWGHIHTYPLMDKKAISHMLALIWHLAGLKSALFRATVSEI